MLAIDPDLFLASYQSFAHTDFPVGFPLKKKVESTPTSDAGPRFGKRLPEFDHRLSL